MLCMFDPHYTEVLNPMYISALDNKISLVKVWEDSGLIKMLMKYCKHVLPHDSSLCLLFYYLTNITLTPPKNLAKDNCIKFNHAPVTGRKIIIEKIN